MGPAEYVISLVGIGLLVAWWLWALGPRDRLLRRACAYGERIGAPAATDELARRLLRRRRFVVAGALLGLVLADRLNLAGIYLGLALGALADRLTAPGPPPGPRVAHAASTRLTDYVPRWVVVTVVAAGLCVPGLAWCWLVAPRTPQHLDPDPISGAAVLGLVLLAVAALAGSLVLALVVIGRPQRAGSAAELEVDDALRAQAVRDALQLTAATSFLTSWRLATALTEQDVAGVLRRVGGWYPLLLLIALIVVKLVFEASDGRRHWRRHLVTA